MPEYNLVTGVLLVAIAGILYYAYRKEKIDDSAIVSTAIIGFTCLFAFGNDGIIPLVIFFVVGNIVSHYKRKIKRKFGVEQSIRTWKNVFANGGASAVFSLLYIYSRNNVYFLGLIGSMATAMADTSATELGQIYGKNPRLMYNLKRVPIGTPGAISPEGFIFALIGSGIISSLLSLWNYRFSVFLVCLFSGFLCSVVDSILGCTLEARGYINTHMINFLTTLLGGILVVLLV